MSGGDAPCCGKIGQGTACGASRGKACSRGDAGASLRARFPLHCCNRSIDRN